MAANRRKVLVPLATLMVAGSVAVGSGASFTSLSDICMLSTIKSVLYAFPCLILPCSSEIKDMSKGKDKQY